MYTTILFDLDGTLMDTSPGIFSTVNHTMEVLGFSHLPPMQLRKFVGPPLAACFRIACGLEESIIPQACQVYRDKYGECGMYNATIYPGIEDVLRTLKGKGCYLGVATLKYEQLAMQILNHFGLSNYMDVVVGSDKEGILSKADIITTALKRLGVTDLDSVAMVGDTPHDQDGASSVGVSFLGVDYGFGFSKGHPLPKEQGIIGMASNSTDLLHMLTGN
jgi:phosphoglycolate phosphatase